MKYVREILRKKGHDIWCVPPTVTVFEALYLMGEKNCGAVLVVEGGRLLGIFSERDYARKVILKGRTSRDTLVDEIMSRGVVCIQPSQSVDQCMALMTKRRIRHLPVVDEENNLVGIISIGDVVKEVISEQEFIIHQLELYITDSF